MTEGKKGGLANVLRLKCTSNICPGPWSKTFLHFFAHPVVVSDHLNILRLNIGYSRSLKRSSSSLWAPAARERLCITSCKCCRLPPLLVAAVGMVLVSMNQSSSPRCLAINLGWMTRPKEALSTSSWMLSGARKVPEIERPQFSKYRKLRSSL